MRKPRKPFSLLDQRRPGSTLLPPLLASRPPFQRSVEALRAEGVRILLGPGGIQPHPPRTGGDLIDSYPWHLALDEAEHMLAAAQPSTPDSQRAQ